MRISWPGCSPGQNSRARGHAFWIAAKATEDACSAPSSALFPAASAAGCTACRAASSAARPARNSCKE